MLTDQTLSKFLEAVAARTPTPGGGSVSAAAAALGAAIGVMVGRFSKGDAARDAADAIWKLAGEARILVDEDAKAYGLVDSAVKLPKSSPEERARRDAALQDALIRAAEVPLRGVRLAHRGLDLLGGLAKSHNRNLETDLLIAADLLHAGGCGFRWNVLVNLAAIKDPAAVAKLKEGLGIWTEARAMHEWFQAQGRLWIDAKGLSGV